MADHPVLLRTLIRKKLIAVAKRPCDCCYSIFARTASARGVVRLVARGATATGLKALTTGLIFTALHVMRYSDENSVRLSVTRVISDKTEERSVQIFTPYERTFSLVF